MPLARRDTPRLVVTRRAALPLRRSCAQL